MTRENNQFYFTSSILYDRVHEHPKRIFHERSGLNVYHRIDGDRGDIRLLCSFRNPKAMANDDLALDDHRPG
ncbi:MAG: hypothetical protein US81_C0015G0017 [Parcubacteria group bacterium GW2011_GWE2_38_18]|nr:MAG: hypothetical protein US81_C0015G0017 [Parcubacteria group bacterium GW2011_GWE2_38_18]